MSCQPHRYRLLDSPRAFARELLAAAGEAEAVRTRHARAVVEGDKMVDLNKRLRAQDRARHHLYSAAWIHNAGQIAATALDLRTDTQLAVRLDPVR